MSSDAAATPAIGLGWNKYLFMSIGIILFVIVYYSPPWPAALDPEGKAFALSPEGKGALAVFLLAATWWVFEVVPIGVTSLTIGVLQVLFFIRPAKDAFKDFMDPSVLCSSSVPLWWVWCLPKPG
jgi:sodium-dependent dicarboxylate transporter 2/3/5